MKLYNLRLTEKELYHIQISLPLSIVEMESLKEYNEKMLVESPENKNYQSNIEIYEDVQKILEGVLDKIRLISPFKDLNRKKKENESLNQSIQPSK